MSKFRIAWSVCSPAKAKDSQKSGLRIGSRGRQNTEISYIESPYKPVIKWLEIGRSEMDINSYGYNKPVNGYKWIMNHKWGDIWDP